MKKQITDARQAPFVWFDVTLDDAGLSPYAFRLYCRIARRCAGGKSNFFEALTNAATACKMSERQARYAIKDLLKFKMVQRVQRLPGYPTTYALTDKSEWLLPPPAPAAPLHLMQTPPAPDADPPALSAGVPLHQVQAKNTHGRRTLKNTQEEEARARATVHANGNAAAAAASRYTEIGILNYLTAVKPKNAERNSGLAHKLWLTGEDDHLIERWLHGQASRILAEKADMYQISNALDLAAGLLRYGLRDDNERLLWQDCLNILSPLPQHATIVAQLKGLV